MSKRVLWSSKASSDGASAMAAERKVIDVDKSPDLVRLVDEISETTKGIVLHRNGQAVAEITPLPARSRGRRRKMDPAETARILRETAGSWKGLVDPDELIADIYAARDLESRELPDL
jgi:hypothetical protein